MIKRTLGRNLEVTAIGLGCMGLSQSYPPLGKEKSIRFSCGKFVERMDNNKNKCYYNKLEITNPTIICL